ncbi:MAG: hypothetical protein ACJ8EL_21510 [Rhizomicrobium sp.]
MSAKCILKKAVVVAVLAAGLMAAVSAAASSHRLPLPGQAIPAATKAQLYRAPENAKSGSWTPLKNVYPGSMPDLALLLTDGTVMVHEGCSPDWFKLIPDNKGNYVRGTWSNIASMSSDYGPLYFASQVLADGRVIANGGAYNFCSFAETNEGALYDPVSNSWTSITAPAGWSNIGAAPSVVRTDKTYQLANCCSADAALAAISGTNVTWTILSATQTGKKDSYGDEGWTTLPDQTILTIDTGRCLSDQEASCTEIFNINTNTWSDGQRTCGQMVDGKIGPAAMLPNGFVFAAGGTTTNCVMDTSTGQWYPAPSFGGDLDANSAPAAVLPSGSALVQVSPGAFNSPSHFFEAKVKDASTVTVTQVNDPSSAPSVAAYEGRMLVLPTGQVFWTNDAGDIEIYTAKGSPKAAWAPKITKVAGTLSIGSSNNRISGRNFNGFTFGGYYGAAAQTATNYPLVRLTNAASGHVCYARTHDHNRMGIADGGKSSTKFDIPKSCEAGDSSLEVVANGIASDPASITLQ